MRFTPDDKRTTGLLTIETLNDFPADEARARLARCCGAERWIEGMLRARPFRDWKELAKTAQVVWDSLPPADWKEAFRHHPKIGDLESLKKKFATTGSWAKNEQGSVNEAPLTVLNELAEGNTLYEDKFGYIFIVCATGKSAEEMLAILRSRLPNEPAAELRIAAAEQIKITLLRLEKLRDEPDNNPHS